MAKDFERKSLFADELKSDKGAAPPEKAGKAGKADSLDDLFGGDDKGSSSSKDKGSGRLNVKTW